MRSLIMSIPLMLMLTLTTVNAQPGPGWKMDDLNLSDAQIKQLDDLRFQNQKLMIQKRADLKEAELDMRRMMRNTDIDEKAVLAKQKEISGLKASIAEERVKHQMAMRKILTPEQLQQFLKERRGRGRGFDGDFQGGGRGMHKDMRSGKRMGPKDGSGPGRNSDK